MNNQLEFSFVQLELPWSPYNRRYVEYGGVDISEVFRSSIENYIGEPLNEETLRRVEYRVRAAFETAIERLYHDIQITADPDIDPNTIRIEANVTPVRPLRFIEATFLLDGVNDE